MSRWTRAAGLLASTLFVVGVVLVALLGGGGPPDAEGPPPDLRNGRVFIQDNLWTTNGREYAVWVGRDGTPYAGSRRTAEGSWTQTDLGRLPGNPLSAPTDADNHNVYVLGVDARGRIHIAGNMRIAPLRYIRTRAARLGEWTATKTPVRTDRATYPAFVGLPDGTLLFFRRQAPVGTGSMELLDVLRPGSDRWRSYGAVVDGRATQESAYLHHVAADPDTGMIHLLFEWRGTGGPSTNNDVAYARSADGGRTWERSDGTPLPTPITHSTAETVIDSETADAGLVNQGGFTTDADGRPHGVVRYRRPGEGGAIEHVWLEEGEWQRESFDDTDIEGRPQVVGMPDGRIWLLGVAGTTVKAVDITPDRDRADTQELATVPLGWEVNYDSQALAREGVLRMLIPSGDRPRVVESALSP